MTRGRSALRGGAPAARGSGARLYAGLVAVLVLMVACEPALRWYEDACIRKGYPQGSQAFAACVQREEQWLRQQYGSPRAQYPTG